MNAREYHAFTEALLRHLAADDRVLGLIACGSMAATYSMAAINSVAATDSVANRDHAPDEWSDHDFWIVTVPGAQEHFRAVYDWLPDAGRIVFALRETAHGLKILYAGGHLIEYAVFAPDELRVTKANAYRVLLDRERIAARMAEVRARTVEWAASLASDDRWLFGQFITNLWVGVGRHRRGERLSGHDFVKRQAVGHLLPLLVRHGQADRRDMLDDIDPLRRFEFAFPQVGAELNRLLLLETPACAAGLLDLAGRQLRGRLPDYPDEAVAVIRRHIESACSG